jgi:putative nucleotidyltransferase with HDIG domain
MLAKLHSIVGFDGQDEVVLSPERPITIGRGDEADLTLDYGKVSREHCRIVFERGFYHIEDLGSKNGTWVNSRRVHRAILFHDDRIDIGSTEFRFLLESSDEDTSAAIGDADTEMAFQTEIRNDPTLYATSSLLMERPEQGLEQDRDELERGLEIVCEVISRVNAENDLDRLLATIMDSVMEVTHADRSYLIAGQELDGALLPLVSRHSSSLPVDMHDSFSHSIVGDCCENGIAILVADPAQQGKSSDSVFVQRIQSVMCVPMVASEGPVGAIYVDTLEVGRRFTERELRVLAAIADQAGTAIRRAQLSHQVETLFRDSMRTVINLVEVKDEYTYGHSERVTALAGLLAELCGMNKAERRDIELAGLLHDVGKLAVRLDILQKPTGLTPEEYEAIKRHPVAGAAILGSVENAERISAAVRHHHEHWDGTGYPHGLAGQRIPLAARILALADAFDSMAGGRPYRAEKARKDIVEELKTHAGTQFDPTLTKQFVDALAENAGFAAKVDRLYKQRDGSEAGHATTVIV